MSANSEDTSWACLGRHLWLPRTNTTPQHHTRYFPQFHLDLRTTATVQTGAFALLDPALMLHSEEEVIWRKKLNDVLYSAQKYREHPRFSQPFSLIYSLLKKNAQNIQNWCACLYGLQGVLVCCARFIYIANHGAQIASVFFLYVAALHALLETGYYWNFKSPFFLRAAAAESVSRLS